MLRLTSQGEYAEYWEALSSLALPSHFLSARLYPACQTVYRNAPEESDELFHRLIVVLAGHEDRLLRRPLLPLQSPLARPVPLFILDALDRAALHVVALEDRGARGLLQLGVGLQLVVELLVRDLCVNFVRSRERGR